MTRMRALLAVLVAALAGGLLAAPAAALVDPSVVATADVAVEDGVAIRDEAVQRLEDAARELRAAGTPVKLIVLDQRPGDPFAYARSVREELRFGGDVLVLSATPRRNLAIASPLPSGAVDRVYDGRLDELRQEPVAGTIAVARDLAAVRSGAALPPARDDGDGGSAGAVLLVMLLVGGGAVLVATVAGRRRRRVAAERELTAGAAALEPLVDALAAQISDLEEDMAVGGPRAREAAPHHEAAVLAYGEARDAMAGPPTPAGVRTAGATLERGLHAAHRARAALEGRPPDEADAEPLLEGMCAFDPKHGRATDTVAISTPDGDTAELPACARCAAQMARGEQPRFREVEEDGRLVPYWRSRGMAGGAGYGFGVPVLGGALAGLMLGGLLGAGTADAAGFDDPGVGGGDFGDFGGGGGFGGGDFGGGGFGGGDF